jgi:toxin FitB
LEQVCDTYNILSMDGRAFRCWAQQMHRQSDILFEDAMIAAIAKVQHHLTVVTRNLADFSRFEVPLPNPFTAA